MKSFLEEYGLIIVAIIVVAALIGLAIYFKTSATDKAQGNFDTFTNKADQIVNENMNGAGGSGGTGGTGEESGGTGGETP